VIASYVNVDSRHRAERAVALQADRTRSILDSVLVGIVTVGPQGIEWMNRSARRMFGGDLADFVSLPIATVATAEPDHPFLRTDYLTELVEGQAETFECRVKARDGREFWVVGNVVSIGSDAAGRQLTYALLDIERRREAEARVSQTQSELQRILAAAPLAITLRDARTLKILQVNEVAAASAHATPAELLGRTPEQSFDAETAPQRRRDMEEALASPDVTQREYRVDHDGEPRVWDARYLPLAAGPGLPPDQLLLIATDVTEQRVAQEARLADAIAQREMLVKEVHHRIKNNLQGVAGLLQQFAQRTPEMAGPIAEVVAQVQAIAQVYGLQVGESGPLQLVGVVQAITTSVQRTFGRAIRFAVSGPTAPQWLLPEAEAIPIALTLNELLTNAVKHSAAQPASEIVCTLDCGEAEVEVAIANTARLPAHFSLARLPGGVSGLGLVRALLPRRSAALALDQRGDQVVATVLLRPPGVQRNEPG
jgi:PAS domain S-box-containing protein